MADIKSIKKRISSVKNTQKITKAMKMVSAAKLRRATEKAQSSRPYEEEITGIVRSVLSQVNWESELTAEREVKRAAIVIVSTDRGLCGSLNSNLFKEVRTHLRKNSYGDVEVYACGKKARMFAKSEGLEIAEEHLDLLKEGDFSFFRDLSARITKRFLDGEVDRVFVFYNRFQSALFQVPEGSKVLPFETPDASEGPRASYIYEPAPELLLEKLVPMLLDFRIYRAALESFASEHAARMAAMDAATNNCRDMIASLTLVMNRARQAAITKELMEIIGGAEAISA